MRVTKKIIFIAVNVLLLAAITVCAANIALTSNVLQAQKAAGRWSGESGERFAQVSCFFPVGQGIGEEQVRNIRSAVDEKLKGNSLEAPEGGSLWTDAYSGQGTLSAETKYGSSKVKAVGVGGDYFFFHNLRLLSGSYISGGDIMKDRVILDEALAWKLFGSSDLEGMEITIGGASFFVAGVIESEKDRFSQRTYGGDPVMYMSYETFFEMTGASVSCYEAVLPDQITGFAQDIIKTSLPMPDAPDIVENSARYTAHNIISLITDFGVRSIQEKGIIYPYWENAARLTEDNMALLLVIITVLSVVPVIGLVVLTVILIRLLAALIKKAFRSALGLADKRINDKRRARYYGVEEKRKGKLTSVKKTKKLPPGKKAPPVISESVSEAGDYYGENGEIQIDIEELVKEILEEDWGK